MATKPPKPFTLKQLDESEQRCRVFISYQHSDKDSPRAAMVEEIIRKMGHIPCRDAGVLRGGVDFTQVLARYIHWAHSMVVIVSPESESSSWMHNEVGYATAHSVPIYPIAFDGAKLLGMNEKLHRLDIHQGMSSAEVRALIRKDLGRHLNDLMTAEELDKRPLLYECAAQPEDRAPMMARYANEVSNLGHYARVRQYGGLSTFHIPLEPYSSAEDSVWRTRYTPNSRRRGYCESQLKEREAFQKHADMAGFRLIVDPYYKRGDFDESAWRVRVGCLIQFLEQMLKKLGPELCQIVINEDQRHAENRTILGNWFTCEAYAYAEEGNYRQTIFTRNTSAVKDAIKSFDQDFFHRLGTTPVKECCRLAIARLRAIHDGLPKPKAAGKAAPAAKRGAKK